MYNEWFLQMNKSVQNNISISLNVQMVQGKMNLYHFTYLQPHFHVKCKKWNYNQWSKITACCILTLALEHNDEQHFNQQWPFFDWKTSKWAYHLLQFFISYWEKFSKLTMFITQSYLLLLNLLLFLNTFSVVVNDYFFRWLAYKSLLSRFSVFINCIMWSYNLFFLCPGFTSSPTLLRIFSCWRRKNVKIKAKFIKFIKYITIL